MKKHYCTSSGMVVDGNGACINDAESGVMLMQPLQTAHTSVPGSRSSSASGRIAVDISGLKSRYKPVALRSAGAL